MLWCVAVQYIVFLRTYLTQIVPPLRGPIVLTDFNCEQFEICHECRNAGKALSAAATHANKQGVAVWLLDDTGDAADVLRSVPTRHTHTHTHTHIRTQARQGLFCLHIPSALMSEYCACVFVCTCVPKRRQSLCVRVRVCARLCVRVRVCVCLCLYSQEQHQVQSCLILCVVVCHALFNHT